MKDCQDPAELRSAGTGDWVVEPGDSINSIAHRTGHVAETLWSDASNAGVREIRVDPEILLPGDRIVVPPVHPKTMTCATGKRHVFRRLGVPAKVTLIVEDEDGEPFVGKRYEISVSGKVLSGVTAEDGKIQCAVPPADVKATLRVWIGEPGYPDPLESQVVLGGLDPVRHLRGVQQRLYNLGHLQKGDDGKPGPETAQAILDFQRRNGLEPTGALDDATLDKLAAIHRA